MRMPSHFLAIRDRTKPATGKVNATWIASRKTA
jgi:hypothetical protein